MTPHERDEADELGWDVVTAAVDRLKVTERRAKRSRQLANMDNRLDRWAEVEASLANDARRDLVRAVLATDATHGHRDPDRAEKSVRPPVGVEVDGIVYLAIPDPDVDELTEGRSGYDRMVLIIYPAAAVRDVSEGLAIEVYSPGPPPAADSGPGDPEWLKAVTEAARTLGEHEAKRRMWLVPDKKSVSSTLPGC